MSEPANPFDDAVHRALAELTELCRVHACPVCGKHARPEFPTIDPVAELQAKIPVRPGCSCHPWWTREERQ